MSNDIDDRIKRITGSARAEADLAIRQGDHGEARRALSAGIRDLRDLKRDVADREREVRESFQDARLKNRESGQVVGMFVSSKARGAMSRARAVEGRRLTAKQAEALRPLSAAKAAIDRAVAQLDREKAAATPASGTTAARVTATGPAPVMDSGPAFQSTASAPRSFAELYAGSAPSAAPVVPVPPPAPPPMWAPDPYGRHEVRWWDGARWTEHVTTNGVAMTDAV